jgi:hypothetical protein
LTRTPRSLFRSVIRGELVVAPAVLVGCVVAIASWLVGPDRGTIPVDVAMASMGAFLFGVLLAFAIQRTRERLALVQNLVATDNSSLLSIYQMVEKFEIEDRHRIRWLIDHYLTDQVDFPLIDYHLASASHIELTDAIYALEPRNTQQQELYKELIVLCINMGTDRSLIEAAAGQALSALEWSGLLILLLVLLALITVLPGGRILGAIVVGLLAGALVTLVILVRKLDLLRWHERVSIWEPTTRLFRSMGQDPYVPRDVIESGRYRPTGRVRIVDYPDPYPIRKTKVVTVTVLDGAGTLDVGEKARPPVDSPP